MCIVLANEYIGIFHMTHSHHVREFLVIPFSQYLWASYHHRITSRTNTPNKICLAKWKTKEFFYVACLPCKAYITCLSVCKCAQWRFWCIIWMHNHSNAWNEASFFGCIDLVFRVHKLHPIIYYQKADAKSNQFKDWWCACLSSGDYDVG